MPLPYKATHFAPSPQNPANAMLTRTLHGRYVFEVHGEKTEWRSKETFHDTREASEAWWNRPLELEIVT